MSPACQPRPGPDRLLVELYSGATGERERRWIVPASDLARVASSLSPEERPPPGDDLPDPPPRVVGAGDPEGPVAATPPWYRRWWVWTLVGTAVLAGAAAGAAVAVTGAGRPAELGVEVSRRW